MVSVSDILSRLRERDSRVLDQLGEVYYNADAGLRVLSALEKFAERFPAVEQATVVRAPGRVNLVGEHLDYNGLPVMPMAIDYDMLAVCSPRQDKLIKAVNPEFPDREFTIDFNIPHFETGDWGNYVKAAVQGLVRELGGPDKLRGMNICFQGSVPISAGLSSSSSLVVAAALSLLEVSDVQMDRLRLAEMLGEAEWYAGTEGGAMDQTASLFGEREKALRISFYPLGVDPVTLPEGVTVVVANTLVEASKSKNVRLQFNTRHAVCRMATALLARKLGLEGENIRYLGDIFARLSREELTRALKENLKWHGYTKTELAYELGITLEELNERFCTTAAGEHISAPPEGFRLLARARHVITEAARVEDAWEAMHEYGQGRRLGTLMSGSYWSCRHNYEVSHPAIDDLVAIGIEAGSLGSRLTGAGFGGCTVHLVPDRSLDAFLEEIEQRYYNDAIHSYPEAARRYREKETRTLLVLKASSGARVLF